MDLTKMRHRMRGGFSTAASTAWTVTVFDSTGRQTNKYFNPGVTDSVTYSEQMWDIPTPGYRKKSREGKIVNSPMRREIRTSNLPPTVVDSRTVYNDGGSATVKGIQPLHYPDFSLETSQVSIDTAITQAYANITANEQNALLWLGEFRETIDMFHSMGQSLLKLIRSTAKQRKRYLEGKLSVSEAQELTLMLLYGLLPLSSSIEQWQKGLLKHKPAGRNTARGFNTFTDSKTISYDAGDANFKIQVTGTERLETNIRAGVLYDVELPDFPVLTAVDVKSVVSTLYALSRLSFVLEWFINVGSTLTAWSPSLGTRELSAWVVVEEKFNLSFHNTWSPKLEPHEISQTTTGSSSGNVLKVVKRRIPIDRSDLNVLPRLDINLNLDKIFALMLLFLKAKKS